ncbi:glycosyltransferase [Phocaeicola plebeius]|uniref:glycosyltransferase n=1 Tax=Phocaeicola plebeius TaxID=310297 RepID=UPI0026F13EAA|nr:glycosyltransferase [Phocaeicola plebeius]
MKTEIKTLVVIVTYNRLSDLKACVNALSLQTYKYFDIVVVNNGSTDGTKEWLESKKELIVINQANLGGAGGFYSGMKFMLDHDYENIILMDDDGIPDKSEIENLICSYQEVARTVGKEIILNALVVNKEDSRYTSFSWARGSKRTNLVKDLQKDLYFNDIHPFNGTLIKRSTIEKIGMIKKEMFIWGDEKEYMARAIHNNIGLYTLTTALHYHPKEKGIKGNVIPGIKKYQILVKPAHMSHFYYRNEGFIYYNYPAKRRKMWLFCTANILYNLTHFRFGELFKFIRYFRKGMNNDYSSSE